jgi:hypothetical protein
MHNIGRLKSEPARKALEIEYGLIKAEDRKKDFNLPVKPAGIEVAVYGKEETKRTITNIVQQVIKSYAFTSFDEYNKILLQFGVTADLHQTASNKKGITYSMVNKWGEKKGIPIHASDIFNSPTYANIQKKFGKNFTKRDFSMARVQSKVMSALSKSGNEQQFLEELQRRHIGCCVSYNQQGGIGNIDFIDHASRIAITASDAGITPESIIQKLSAKNALDKKTPERMRDRPITLVSMSFLSRTLYLLDLLMRPAYSGPDLASGFFKRRRKKGNF